MQEHPGLNAKRWGSFPLASLDAHRLTLAFVFLLLLSGFAPCARPAQRLVCWGDIAYDMAMDGDLSQVSPGYYHTLAMYREGGVLAWGDNKFNQTNLPDVLKSKPAAAIAAGNLHNLALMPDGRVLAWGPGSGQIGDYGQCSVPAELGLVVNVAAGAVHNLALKPDGKVVAWGANLNGQCDVPAGLDSVIAIAGGMYHSLALRKDGTVVAWGDNAHGQTSIPAGVTNVVAIAAGGFHNLALKSDGSVVSWGTYGLAQSAVPMGLSNIIAIATGDLHSLALKADGSLVVWGFNTAGQCSIPQGLTNIVAIAARGRHSVALMGEQAYNGPPALNIETAPEGVVISWPIAPAQMMLQQNTNLDPATWTAVLCTPNLVGTRNAVVLPAAGSVFFRLVSQP
jgi:Regulator of chromosome condensation (RCC1) repeat